MAPITLLNKGSLIPYMGESKSDLDKIVPIDYIMNWIGAKLDSKKASSPSDRVMILRSLTGSGKSSSLAPNIYLRFFNKYRKRIVITQPRVLTTVEIPKDIAEIDAYKKPNKNGLSIELYRNLGYQTQEFVNKPKEKGILFCTTGILLQFLKTMPDEQFCKRYKFVIIDEAHDRSLDVDLILLMMKRLINRTLSKEPPFLILMSATLNIDQYKKYFNTKTVFGVDGQSKPIEVIYPKTDIDDIYTYSCQLIKDLEIFEKKNPTEMLEKGIRDVIIFMPYTKTIQKMILALSKLNTSLAKKILPIGITSADINGGSDNFRLVMEDYKKLKVEIDGKLVPAYRRVIVSTNVAETGLTLESLRYCIDTALQFTNEFNSRYGVNVLLTKSTTSSMSLQRKGRVGRKHAGVFFPLFTEDTFKNMIVDNTPSIMYEDMTAHMLALLTSEPVSSPDLLPVYDMLTPASDDSINYSLQKLFVLGAIDASCMVTKMGKMMNIFRKLGVESRKMILSGLVHDAPLKELVCLACLLEVRKSELVLDRKESGVNPYDVASLFDELYELNPTFDRSKCDTSNFNRLKAKLLISCELLELLLIYQRFSSKAYLPINELRGWCITKGLNYRGLSKLSESIDEVYWQMLEQMRINPIYTNAQPDLYDTMKRSGSINIAELVDAVSRLKKCIYEGFKLNILKWNPKTSSYQTSTGIDVVVTSKLVSPLSYQKIGAKFDQERPKLLIYKELIVRQDMIGKFVYEAAGISVMDGFVNADLEFENL